MTDETDAIHSKCSSLDSGNSTSMPSVSETFSVSPARRKRNGKEPANNAGDSYYVPNDYMLMNPNVKDGYMIYPTNILPRGQTTSSSDGYLPMMPERESSPDNR